jgi:hypothetical protein
MSLKKCDKIQLMVLLLLLKTAIDTKQWRKWPPSEATRVRPWPIHSFHRPRSLSVRLIDAFDGVKSISRYTIVLLVGEIN